MGRPLQDPLGGVRAVGLVVAEEPVALLHLRAAGGRSVLAGEVGLATDIGPILVPSLATPCHRAGLPGPRCPGAGGASPGRFEGIPQIPQRPPERRRSPNTLCRRSCPRDRPNGLALCPGTRSLPGSSAGRLFPPQAALHRASRRAKHNSIDRFTALISFFFVIALFPEARKVLTFPAKTGC